MPTFTPPAPPAPFTSRHAGNRRAFPPAVMTERTCRDVARRPAHAGTGTVMRMPEVPRTGSDRGTDGARAARIADARRTGVLPRRWSPVAPSPVIEPARVSAPPPLPARRPAPVPVNGNEKMAGTYTLVVYPFTRFSDLGQFQSVLQELVGIHDIQVRRFAQGTLEMRLGYDGNDSPAAGAT